MNQTLKSKALIAMSGGVDSAVAALLMKEQGYECTGITMKLIPNDDTICDIAFNSEKSCCSIDDVSDARSIADTLSIPFYVLNFTADFKEEVINRFVSAYQNGATPNPCIDCNRFLKFEKMFRRALQLEHDIVATGHYAQIEKDSPAGRMLLKKAVDDTKDQSYVLYSMTQEQLSHTVFPLGGYKKTQVREIAENHNFINAKKHDSQDICFVPDGDYARFIEKYTSKKYEQGHFIDCNGNILGKHNGQIRYTIGQRKGLGLSLPKPLYVCAKNTKDNTVVLGEEKELYSKSLIAKDINLIAYKSFERPLKLKAKIRYKQPEQDAVVEQIDEDTLHIEFNEPQRAVTKGQAVVLYDGDVVIGGGTIY